MKMLRHETIYALKRRRVSAVSVARLLNCIPSRAEGILAARVPPDAREKAILKLCSNTPANILTDALCLLDQEYEWRSIPGYSRYEAHHGGAVRRSANGHGAMPGVVLRPRHDAHGHLYVNVVSDADGKIRKTAVHRLVCLAFHGATPAGRPYACHRNDTPDDNRAANLYWGSPYDNAADRSRNGHNAIGTRLTQRPDDTKSLAYKKWHKRQMVMRLKRAKRAVPSLGRGVPAPLLQDLRDLEQEPCRIMSKKPEPSANMRQRLAQI